jgi:hypothetical protein
MTKFGQNISACRVCCAKSGSRRTTQNTLNPDWATNIAKYRAYRHMLKLVKLQNLAAKCCKMRAIFSVGLYFLHFTTSDLATKLCNFINFNMLFLAVVMDFVLVA